MGKSGNCLFRELLGDCALCTQYVESVPKLTVIVQMSVTTYKKRQWLNF